MDLHSFGQFVPYAVGHGYLDPGSGSFILQLLIATLLGSLFIIKGFWAKIKAFITRRPPEDATSESDDEE